MSTSFKITIKVLENLLLYYVVSPHPCKKFGRCPRVLDFQRSRVRHSDMCRFRHSVPESERLSLQLKRTSQNQEKKNNKPLRVKEKGIIIKETDSSEINKTWTRS